jgi:pimeloyl-ACP methyl ester carboxylesterase
MIFYKVIEKCSAESPWIIMVHGFTHNHVYFNKQIEHFQNAYKLLLVDLRGHGKSVNSTGPFGVEEYADDIEEVLAKLQINRFNFWGTHTGAAIGLVLALRNQSTFSSLILEGTFLPGFEMPKTAELINTAKTIAKQNGVEAALQYWYNTADWFNYIREYPEKCRAIEHQDMLTLFSGSPLVNELSPREATKVFEMLTEIKIPALVYNGEFDLQDFKNAAKHLEKNLPNVQLKVISEAGGFPGWENYYLVNSLVQNYLDELAC